MESRIRLCVTNKKHLNSYPQRYMGGDISVKRSQA